MKSSNQFLLALATAFTLTACGGGGGGDSTTDGGSTGGSTNISLPSNAIVLDSSNAVDVAESSIAYMDLGYAAFGVESQPIPPARQVIDTVKERVFNNDYRNHSVVSGATETYNCSGGGSITDNYTETSTGWNGTATFNSCNEGGAVLNGSLSYNESWNETTFDYSGSANGSITVTFGGESFTMNLNVSETGNEDTGNFSMTVNYSVSGSNIGGWLVQTESPIVGNYVYGTYSSGRLIITGANNTKVRVTVVPDYSATVELSSGDSWTTIDTITL